MKASAASNSPRPWSGTWRARAGPPSRSPTSWRGIPTASAPKYADRLHAEVARCLREVALAQACGGHRQRGSRERAVAADLDHHRRAAARGQRGRGRAAAARPRDLSARRAGRAAGADQAQGRRRSRHAGLAPPPGDAALSGRDPDLRRALPEVRRPLKEWVAVNAPDQVAETYLARQGAWKLPMLSGIVHTPFLRADGSICEQPGYDPASGLLFKPDGQSFPPIPREPSKADALAALASSSSCSRRSRSSPTADRSVALSAILTSARSPRHGDRTPARLHVANCRDRQNRCWSTSPPCSRPASQCR